MAKETIFVQVAPSAVEETIQIRGYFGWELVGAPQEVRTQDVQVYSGQSSDGNTKYYETKKGDHYVKITLQRDKSIPNYAELCDLEQKYNDVPNVFGKPDEPKRLGCMGVLAIVSIIIGGILAVGEPVVGLFILLIGAAILAFKLSSYRKKQVKWQAEYDDWKERSDEYDKFMNARPEIIQRAKALLG